MKLSRKIIALCLGATLALGSTFGLAACNGNNDDTGSAGDPNIRLVYNMYVENCAAKGEEALTYEDWLASIKGEDGKDGVTPHIDTESGHWFVGETDTGIPATGAKGDPGDDGDDGTSFRHGHGKPTDSSLGIVGDLYLDLDTYDLYEKTAEGWSTDPVGNIKGAKGDKGDKGDSAAGDGEAEEPIGTVIKEYSNVKIEASGNYVLDLSEVTAGHYWIVAETDTSAGAGVLSAESTYSYKRGTKTKTSTVDFDLYSSKTQKFKGFAMVDANDSYKKVSVKNNSAASITATLKLVEYEPIVVTVGQEIEVPVIPGTAAGADAAKVGYPTLSFDHDSLAGKSVKFTFTYWAVTEAPGTRTASAAGTRPGDIQVGSWDPSTAHKDNVWTETLTMPADAVELYIFNLNTTAGFNAIMKIELAS